MPSDKKKRALATKTAVAVQNLQAVVEDDARWRAGAEREALVALDVSLAKLRAVQSGAGGAAVPRRTPRDFEAFAAWLAENGVHLGAAPFRFDFVDGCADNAALFATRDIAEGEDVIVVPSRVMMSEDMAYSSSIAPLFAAAPALRSIPSIVLALYLLAEALDESSRFQPYIRILPSEFTIPFASFSAVELLSLEPSPTAERAINTLRAQVRHYTHIHAALSKLNLPALPAARFTYANFVWAVSVVMTRQNSLPTRQPAVLALIPVWDMCNHAPGPHTTVVAVSPVDGTASVECRAMRAFAPGDVITIFYGARPNAQLLLFSGFVQPGNNHDSLPLSVRIGADGGLGALKARLLGKAGVAVTRLEGEGGWACGIVADADGDVGAGGLAVARVAVMDKGALGALLRSGIEAATEVADAAVEAQARRVLCSAFEDALAEYGGKDDDGDDDSGVRGNRKLVGELHLEERELLRRALARYSETEAR